ncbi:LPS export ABC transporter permease LptG [Acinetobacter wuhouensis]|uniref:LPS export ABC transporter permease LptG n=1 Tax=Acinetobacter wuhouensis TaxID=1879050 RepID=A0A385C0A5_9GAMM|nr:MULTISPECIES: LPS export ABC transporter permease LptG [Acinetobacter]AXQ20934.1 LPS export ABC transporter permease LptG [Acinetobacter wuhouensis]RZG45495.1 LPS export ABC transporter permease LptG [Acinetobacter wuhouensis]RZG72735.1 LPS export ABC transporter permease LptG [Acinetobacter wuhouensis]RZG73107.1 LPS export ABC transporter permease LptG [Acinetobacter sp. WCHAc060025]
MLARRIVAKHVTKTTMLAMLGATAILSGLQILFTYLGELSSLKEGYSAWNALQYVLWGSPKYLYEILPISALIGAILGLGSMASNSELIVMRASGISLWRIVGWVMRSSLVLVILSFALSEFVVPYTSEQAKSIKNHRSAAKLGEVNGYWTREGQRFIYINYANSQGALKQVQVLDFDDQYRLKSVLDAEKGQFLKNGQWDLHDSAQMNILENGQSQLANQNQQTLALALQPKYVHMVTIDPEDLAPSQLLSFMKYMHEYSQVPKTYLLAFWKNVGSPFALLGLVLIACSFIFGPLRQQSMGFRLVIALFVGLGFYYVQDFLGYASLVYAPSPAWFVFLPIVLMFGVGSYLLYRAR